MVGQKKFAKRSIESTVTIDGIELEWRLVSEPLWIPGEGVLRGVRISVQAVGAATRELVLEYPFPNKRNGIGFPQYPQRPRVVPKIVEADIRRAIAGGFDPTSRGKAHIFRVDESSNRTSTEQTLNSQSSRHQETK